MECACHSQNQRVEDIGANEFIQCNSHIIFNISVYFIIFSIVLYLGKVVQHH